jgi:hypothetical protein
MRKDRKIKPLPSQGERSRKATFGSTATNQLDKNFGETAQSR